MRLTRADPLMSAWSCCEVLPSTYELMLAQRHIDLLFLEVFLQYRVLGIPCSSEFLTPTFIFILQYSTQVDYLVRQRQTYIETHYIHIYITYYIHMYVY